MAESVFSPNAEEPATSSSASDLCSSVENMSHYSSMTDLIECGQQMPENEILVISGSVFTSVTSPTAPESETIIFVPETQTQKLQVPNSILSCNSQSVLELPPLSNLDDNFTLSHNVSSPREPVLRINTMNKPYPLPPLNRTLETMGRGTVLLIQFSENDPTVVKSLLSNPLKIKNLIYNSQISAHMKIADVRPNLKKQLIAVENKIPLSDHVLQILTTIKSLNNLTVKCYVPNSDLYSYFTISPIALDTNVTELQKEISQSNDLDIVKLERLKKRENRTWIDSQTMKVAILGNTIPDTLIISYMRYKTNPYFPDPMQCYKCQRMGHTSKSCTAKQPRCMLCGGSHSKNNCDSASRYCVNCKSTSHSANSKFCPVIKTARNIERIRILDKVDYKTARQLATNEIPPRNESPVAPIIDDELMFPRLTNQTIIPTPTSTSEYSFAQAIRPTNYTSTQAGQVSDRSSSPRKQVRDASSQTDFQDTNSCSDVLKQPSDFFLKLRNVLLDVLSINFAAESKQAKINLTDNAIMKNFGIPLELIRQQTTRDTNLVGSKQNPKRKLNTGSTAEDKTSSAEEAEVLSATDTQEDVSQYMWETMEKKEVKIKKKKKKVKQAKINMHDQMNADTSPHIPKC